MKHNLNDLLGDLRQILHGEPNNASWEALKARLERAYVIEGLLDDVVLDYVREALLTSWPQHYGPLLDMWLACTAPDIDEHKLRRSKEDRDRRLLYKLGRMVVVTGW